MRIVIFLVLLLFCPIIQILSQNPELVIQNSHTGDVVNMVFNQAGDRLVSVGKDKTIKIWDVKARKLLRSIEGFTENDLRNVQFGYNDSIIITLEDNFLRYFNIYSGQQVYCIEIESGWLSMAGCYVLKVIRGLNLVALSCDNFKDNYVEFRDLKTGKLINRIGGHATKIVSIQFNHLKNSVLYADYNHIYEYLKGDSISKPVYKYLKTKDGMATMIIEGNLLYILASDGYLATLSLPDFSKINEEKIIENPDFFYTINHPLVVSDSGEIIYYYYNASYQSKLVKHNSSGKTEKEISERAYSITIENSNHWVVISQNGDIAFYSLTNFDLLFSFKNKTNRYKLIEPANSPGCFIASVRNSSKVYYWDLVEGTVNMHTLPCNVDHLSVNPVFPEFALSGGYRYFMVNLPDFEWGDTNLITKDIEYAYNNAYVLQPGEYDIKFSNDGQRFVTQYGNKCGIKLWDRKTLKTLVQIEIDKETQVIEHLDYRSDLNLVLIETSNNYLGNLKTILVDLKEKKVVKEWGENVNSRFFPKSARAFIPLGIVDLLTFKITPVPGYASHNWFNTNPDISSDEKYIAYGYKDSIIIADLLNKTYVLPGIHSGLDGFKFLPGEDRFLSYGEDGTIKLWDASTKQLVATIISEVRDDWDVDNTPISYLIVTPDGYFMGPKNVFKLVAYNYNNEAYSFDQFDAIFNRPDIVLERLGYAGKDLVNAYKTAYRKRNKNALLISNENSLSNQTIRVNILNKNSIPASTANKTLTLKIQISDTSNTVAGYNVWLNGVSKYGLGFKQVNNTSDLITINESLELVSGNNFIEIAAINDKNTESLKEIIEIDYTGKTERNLYLVGIGMSRYSDSTFNLVYPEKDINDFLTYQATSSFFNKISTLKLLDSDFTKNSFTTIENFLLQTTPDDQVVLFYAGHGMLDRRMNYYLGTWDIDFTKPEKNGFPFDTLEYLFNKVLSRERIILIDACHSGLIDNETEYTFIDTAKTSNNIKVANRGARQLQAAPDQMNAFEMMQALFVNLNKGTGTTIISAAGGTQFAYESREYDNGLFTYAYLEGLKTGKADFDKNGSISITEIKNYIEGKVMELSNGLQKPALRQMNYYNDFTVWSSSDTELGQFMKAASNNDVKSLQQFIEKGFNVNSLEEKTLFAPLHYAAREGSSDALKVLIKNGAQVNTKSLFGWTPLNLAVYNNQYYSCLILLLNGADKNIADNSGKTPVNIANSNKYYYIKNLLDNSEEIVHLATIHNPVYFAIREKDTLTLKKLLEEKDIDPDYIHPEYLFAPIHAAIATGDTSIINILLTKGANINLFGNGNITPLMMAAYLHKNYLLKFLLNAGADKRLTDSEGNNAFYYADDEGKKILE